MRKKMKNAVKVDIKPKPEEVKMFGNNIQSCEEGLSPKLNFTKKNKHLQDDDSD
jgi:hypothetical protein